MFHDLDERLKGENMDVEKAEEKLKCFMSGEERASIHAVVIKGGHAYATDGRILVRIKLDGEVGDRIPESYPKSFENVMSEAYFGDDWFTIDHGQFVEQAKVLMKKRNDQIEEDRRDYRDRYKEAVCPECGSVVYFDKYSDSLVGQREEFAYAEMRHVQFPVWFVFGSYTCYANLGYVATVIREFGEDAMFAVNPTDKQGKLSFKKDDMHGILMPLRTDGSINDDNQVKITMHPMLGAQKGEINGN